MLRGPRGCPLCAPAWSSALGTSPSVRAASSLVCCRVKAPSLSQGLPRALGLRAPLLGGRLSQSLGGDCPRGLGARGALPGALRAGEAFLLGLRTQLGALPTSRWTLGAFGLGLGVGSLGALEGFQPQPLTEGAALVGGGELVQQGGEAALLEALVPAAKRRELSGSATQTEGPGGWLWAVAGRRGHGADCPTGSAGAPSWRHPRWRGLRPRFHNEVSLCRCREFIVWGPDRCEDSLPPSYKSQQAPGRPHAPA